MPQAPKRHSVNPPENLHNIGHDLAKKSYDGFVNPGTPQNALVSPSDRKTGVIAGNASQALRERLTPSGNDSIAMSKKVSGSEGQYPSGR